MKTGHFGGTQVWQREGKIEAADGRAEEEETERGGKLPLRLLFTASRVLHLKGPDTPGRHQRTR